MNQTASTPPTSEASSTSSSPPPLPVRGELRHQIDIDHQVYLAIIQGGPAGDLNARLRRLLHLDPPPAPTLSTRQAPSHVAAEVITRAQAPAVCLLANLLGVTVADISVHRDERVPHGQQPVLLLTVTDGARHHEFAVPGGQGDRILAVLPCPLCAEPVATCLIADLAAYGTLLATLPLEAIAQDEQHRVIKEVAHEFFTDPGHIPTCRYSPSASRPTGNPGL